MKQTLTSIPKIIYSTLFLSIICLLSMASAPKQIRPSTPIPDISTFRIITPGEIEKYNKFEIAFDINSTASNPYLPYDENPPAGIELAAGITVDAHFLPPSENDWNHAKSVPCFYYQPVEEVGIEPNNSLLPRGAAEWRCRFAPEEIGVWQFKVSKTDVNGTFETAADVFNSIDCATESCKGFVGVSPTHPQFFAFSNGDPFITPLVSMEQNNPFNTLSAIRNNIPTLGNNGIRFVRWFPTGEGANMFVAPFGDTLRINWAFGDSYTLFDDVDTEAGKQTRFRPYFYATQNIPVEPGQYRFTFRGKAVGEQVMRLQLGNNFVDICAPGNTHHTTNREQCDYFQDDWQNYTLEANIVNSGSIQAGVRGLYVSTDAPAPFNVVQDGDIGVHSMQLQRYEEDRGAWSANLLTRSDPDTHTYIDQISAAKLDEIFALSEQFGIYHKLPLFHKNDELLNRMLADGSFGKYDNTNHNFYASENLPARWYQEAYARYFVGRWSYSTALHSLELANETNPWDSASQTAGLNLARFIHASAPRHIMMSDSFWHSFPTDFWSDPDMDYADKHWYTKADSDNGELVSLIYDDSAAYVRECWQRFHDYQTLLTTPKPILRGEGGVWDTVNWGQHTDVALEPTGTWYHKKLWAHLGTLAFSCDGEWYPRLFMPPNAGMFPNDRLNLGDMFAAYENFIQAEPLNNGAYVEIGTDLTGDQQVLYTEDSGNIRAWGVRDSKNKRALLWIDNAEHTWRNVVDGVSITPGSATLTLQGLTPDIYVIEVWDTHEGTVTSSSTVFVSQDGKLAYTVTDLATDVALKIRGIRPPQTINDLTISPAGNGIILDWTAVSSNTNGDPTIINHYNIYRSTMPYFLPTAFYLFASTNATDFTDVDILLDYMHNYNYLVTAVDTQNNESNQSNHVGKHGFLLQ